MVKLTVTLTDNGKPREAIPVRAVPLVTDWFVSPDLLAIALAGGDCSFRPGLKAYKIEEEEIKVIPPADWRLITDQLQAIDASLPAGVPGKYEWRERSISELPSTAFLWADEFSDAYRKSFNNAIHLELSEGETLHANGEVRIPMVVSDQLQRVALEGFPDIPAGILTAPVSKNLLATKTLATQTIGDDAPLCPEEKAPSSLALDSSIDSIPTFAPETWQAIARSIGKDWMEEQIKLAEIDQKLDWQNAKAMSCPGVNAIAAYVEGELSNRGITGKRGNFLYAPTIKREALAGITGRSRTGKS